MLKLDIKKMKLQFENNNYKYILERINDKLILMRKDIYLGLKKLIVLDLESFNVNMFGFKNTKEKDEIINDIIQNLRKNKMAKDICNIEELEKVLKTNCINIIISNDNIGLSTSSTNNLRNNEFIIDIILEETKSIIGFIKFNNGNFKIEVEDRYKQESLKLLESLNNLLYKNEYMKVLENNS